MSARSKRDAAFLVRYGPWGLVTGASDGIGRESAIALAERGLSLVLAARREDALRDLAAELERAHGIETRVHAADLGSDAAVDGLIAATADLEIGFLGAYAGFGTSGPLAESDLAAERAMLAVNCGATLGLVHAFAQRFASRGRGGMVLMSSIVAFQGAPRAAHYAATKSYVQTFAEGLAIELKPLGVDVVASAPGPVGSGFAARAGMTMHNPASARSAARPAIDALGRRSFTRPGLLSKALGVSLSTLPRRVRTMAMTRIMRGMTSG